MPYADNQSTRIHYQVEGDGPPLVLQHGFTGNLMRWYSFGYVSALQSSYRLVLVDARGHGQSDKPHDPAAYALPRRVGDVVACWMLSTSERHTIGATRWADGLDSAWRSTRLNASVR